MTKVDRFALLIINAVLIAGLISALTRVERLEQACHAQCSFGDTGCAERCAKDGHCPFQGVGE